MRATGRLPEFEYVIDYQLPPLFGFFRSATVPGGIYASDMDFGADGGIHLEY
jgi:FMN reductase